MRLFILVSLLIATVWTVDLDQWEQFDTNVVELTVYEDRAVKVKYSVAPEASGYFIDYWDLGWKTTYALGYTAALSSSFDYHINRAFEAHQSVKSKHVWTQILSNVRQLRCLMNSTSEVCFTLRNAEVANGYEIMLFDPVTGREYQSTKGGGIKVTPLKDGRAMLITSSLNIQEWTSSRLHKWNRWQPLHCEYRRNGWRV